MKNVKRIESGTVTPNTIEINQNLCYMSTFDENVVYEAGFQIKKLLIGGEVVLNDQKISDVKILPDWNISSTVTIKQRYSVPTITDNFNLKLAALNKMNADATWGIRELVLSKGRDRYLFKVAGNKKSKRMLLMEKNQVGHHLLDVDELMKEFSDLFQTTCFFKPAINQPPMMCDIPNR